MKTEYTVSEVATMLDVTTATVREYCVTGVFPEAYKRRGTQWRIPQGDIDAHRAGKLKIKGAFREASIERRFTDWVRKQGSLCVKFSDPANRGAPDRLVLLPGGHVVFFEFKRPVNGKVSVHQKVYHDVLKGLGFSVYVVNDLKEAKAAYELERDF